MTCSGCSRRTLEVFLKGAIGIELLPSTRLSLHYNFQTTRHFTTGARLKYPMSSAPRSLPRKWYFDASQKFAKPEQSEFKPSRSRDRSSEPHSEVATPSTIDAFSTSAPKRSRKKDDNYSLPRQQSARAASAPANQPEYFVKEPWQTHKAALKNKFGDEGWNPRKKLSPDAMEGIRHLHKQYPDKFTTPVLADHFKVSPEAIRRILKSKWRPSDEEQEARMLRWDKRGERIWSQLVETGAKPPKKWRDMGVGRVGGGEAPRWKTRGRNQVIINPSVGDEYMMDDGPGYSAWEGQQQPQEQRKSLLSERML
ncbi:hypothetical protein K432DRAFT_381862 [Lepidopterella palustris CBS 459.81]|uniref:Required for respiratory growth protein 9, mitochondrial n=1 Tax=Lepidopterella palustris CBS 459.81 TaxID=1314670 RepID=A0A8E2JFL9_9PEZI|nr:hypothetical protein K432DRAFT_381862 [Lepidopterella palustris CBS 459.81]